MSPSQSVTRFLVTAGAVLLICSIAVGAFVMGVLPVENEQEKARSAVKKERRVGSANSSKPHPLDPGLELAYEGLTHSRKNVDDYTAVVVKRERIKGELVEEKMLVKIRNRKVESAKNSRSRTVVPFSVYLKFLEPKSKAGREAIYVEGRNNNKLVGHDTGIKNLFRVKLKPDGYWAMMGTRYPITHIGLENMIDKLIEKGERDRQRGECEVKFTEGVKVGDRSCTLLAVTHPHRRPYFDFHIAKIYIDKERNVPLRYAAYQWPAHEGGKPILDEEYVYYDVKLNVGLTDRDFDPDNPKYNYP